MGLAAVLSAGSAEVLSAKQKPTATAGVSAMLGSLMGESVGIEVEEPLSAAELEEKRVEIATEAEEALEAGTELAREFVPLGTEEEAIEATEEPEVVFAGVASGAAVETEAAAETEEAAGTEETAAEAATEGSVEAEAEEDLEPIGGYTNLGIAHVEGNLNIRVAPGEEEELVGKLPADAACEILEEVDGWYHITSGEVEGYVRGDYLLTGKKARKKAKKLMTLVATVTADVLNVRELPNTDCEIVDQIANGEELPILEDMGEWLKVDVDGEERYINAEFVSTSEELKDALTLTEAQYGEGVSDVRVAVVNFATQFVGNPYVWGGTSLTNGADCSGFVLSVMANFGVYLPHYSGSQAQCGTRISVDELQPGDLIFYGSGRRIGHVAIYIGDGQICHAANRRTGITISSMYYRSPICCTRVLG